MFRSMVTDNVISNFDVIVIILMRKLRVYPRFEVECPPGKTPEVTTSGTVVS